MRMNTNKALTPFKESDERRDFEAVLFHRRQSYHSTTKIERDLESVSRTTDTALTHQIKKLQVTQSKLSERIQDLKQSKEKPARWSSMPKISENSETCCLDPYPVTFQSLTPVKLPGGGKFYPRQRRKSKEFEDLPPLSFQKYPSPRSLVSQSTGSDPSRSETKEDTGGSTRRISPIRSQSEAHGVSTSNKENAIKSHNIAIPHPHSHSIAIPHSQKKGQTNTMNGSKSRTENSNQIILNKVDKQIILSSPLSRRKLNSVVAVKQNTTQ